MKSASTSIKLLFIFICSIALSLVFEESVAQSSNTEMGQIRGTIIENETGEPLFGVTVYIKNLDTGASTDFDGKFDLQVPAGSYSLRLTSISYRTIVVNDIEVTPGEINVLGDLVMSQATNEMDEVVVTANSINDTEIAMMTLKRKSANLIDGISSQRFEEIGDSDAGEALKRVTGVSVEGGKYIYVRGLGDRYSKTLLNSVEIPSLDPDKNSLQIDLFPTNLINNMVISKSAVAEMSADFTGGIVNIETKDFPEKPIFDVSFSSTYNPSMHFQSDFLTYDGSSTDFIGFDNGTRQLPENATSGSIPTPISGSDDQQVNQFVNSFSPTLGPKEITNPMDVSAGISLGNQFNLGSGNKKLGYILSGTYKRSTSYYDDYRDGEFQTQPDPNDLELIYATKQNGILTESSALFGGMAGLALKTSRSKIKLTGMRLQNGVSRTANLFVDNSVDAPGQSGFNADSYNLEYSERSITNFLLNGIHYFDNSRWELNWRVSPTLSTIEDPDIRKTTFTINSNGLRFNAGAGGFPNRIWRDMEEVNVAGRVDITGDYRFLGEGAKVKLGSSYVYKDRDYEILAFNMQFFGATPELTGNPSDILKPENIFPNGSIYYQSGNPDPNPNAYSSNATNLAFYVSNEFSLFSKLNTQIGLRAENYVQRHTGRDAIFAQGGNGNNLDNEKVLDALDFFPSANLTYYLTDSQNLRVSYSKTIARPTFKELSFAQILDPVSDRIFNGGLFAIDEWDGNLTETRVDNFDFRWEKFFDRGQLLSASLFYKSFDDPIELVRIQVQATSSEFQPRNVGDGQVYGAELEFRSSLNFLSSRMNNFSINGNLTFVQSEIDMTEQELQARLGRQKVGQEIDEKREMAGQAPYIINGGLQYNNPALRFDAGLFYNVSGETLTVVGGGLFPDVYLKSFNNLKFNANKQIGQGDKATINFSISNLLRDVHEEVFKGFEAEDQIFNRFAPGIAVSAGIKYRF